MISVRVLGPVAVFGEDGVEGALSPELRRLLGLLVVADGAPVSADRLAEYVAEGNVDGSTVRTAVSRLRKVLGDRVESVDGGYRLAVGPDGLDSARFEQLSERARSATGAVEVAVLRKAVELWRGPTLGDLAGEEWAAGWAARLDGMRATAIEDLAEALVREGRRRDAIELLDDHVRDHPYRERPIGTLMRALADDGRAADALRMFERFRITLRDDTGLEPSAELRAVEAGLLTSSNRDDDPVLPSGTVTFLFTDIEGSTQRWQEGEATMTAALTAHDAALREVVGAHGGVVFKHTGDGMCAVFASAPGAVEAAVEAQRRLELPVRMGIHTGEAELREGDYFGPTLNRVARIMDAGHGGQILMSRATAALVPAVGGNDLGEHQLKGLSSSERIFQVGDGEFPALRVATARKGNLPAGLTAFIGRERELASVVGHVTERRLVTLLGVGGTGKTRLAVEAGRALAPVFPDGCWIVELARVSVPEAVAVATCAGLGIVPPENGDAVDLIVRRLRNERRLIVMDNCEHLLDAAAEVVERIAESCPSVSVLATSREPLMVEGEHLVPTPSLSHDDAVAMFLERARSEAPSLEFDEHQMAAIDQLCDRLDRLPLAIELAASRMRSMSPIDAARRLDQRFRLLVGGRRSRMERHQTMRGTVEWSYELCDETEQRVFDRISVFAADFGLDAACAVVGDDVLDDLDVEDAITHLIDRSMVQRHLAADGSSRYRLLETLRAFGHEQLVDSGDADRIRERHATYVAVAVGALSLRALGPDEDAVHAQLRELAPDGLVALDWSLDGGNWERAYRIANGFYYASPGVTFALMNRMHARQPEAPEGLLDDDRGMLMARMAAVLSGMDWRELGGQEALVAYGDTMPTPDTDHWEFGLVSALDPEALGDDYLDIASRWLDMYENAPAACRFTELIATADGVLVARADAGEREIAAAKRLLSEAEALAELIDSETARARCVATALILADLTGELGDVMARAQRALDRVVEPSGGDIWAASRFLRVRSKHGRVMRRDLTRPLDWTLGNPTPVGIGLAQISTVVALIRLGNEMLARRLAASITGSARQVVARFHRESLTDAIFDDLIGQPDASLKVDEVFADVVTFAESLDDPPPGGDSG